jgi:copper(I)-binding protein
MKIAVLGMVLLAVSTAACAQVEARAAWAPATVRGQTAAAAYMQLSSNQGASLIGAESPVAGSVELHEMKMDGNVMRMRAVASLEIPPRQTVELKPGGYHMMLLGLKRPLKKGDLLSIELKFELSDKSVRTVPVTAMVRDRASMVDH